MAVRCAVVEYGETEYLDLKQRAVMHLEGMRPPTITITRVKPIKPIPLPRTPRPTTAPINITNSSNKKKSMLKCAEKEAKMIRSMEKESVRWSCGRRRRSISEREDDLERIIAPDHLENVFDCQSDLELSSSFDLLLNLDY